jgi:hypothetical protein
MPRERIEERFEQARLHPDGTVEITRVERITERSGQYIVDELPRPPRAPNVDREYAIARAAMKTARVFRADVVNTGSTLRLVRESEAA